MKNLITCLFTLIGVFGFASSLYAQQNSSRSIMALGASQEAVPVNLEEVIASINYPRELSQKNIGSKVVCNVLVDSKGKVEDFYVRNTIHTPFVDSVTYHIPELKFVPAKDEKGNALKSWVTIPVVFAPQ